MFATFESESLLAPHEAISALAANTSRAQWFRHSKTLFVGRVWESGFRVARAVRGRDSFNPMVYGQVTPLPNGSRVKLFMTLHPVVWIFMLLWSVSVGHAYFSHPNERTIALIFFIVPWALAVGLFPQGVRTSSELLGECLQLRTKQET